MAVMPPRVIAPFLALEADLVAPLGSLEGEGPPGHRPWRFAPELFGHGVLLVPLAETPKACPGDLKSPPEVKHKKYAIQIHFPLYYYITKP